MLGDNLRSQKLPSFAAEHCTPVKSPVLKGQCCFQCWHVEQLSLVLCVMAKYSLFKSMAQILTELFHKALIVSWTRPKEANQMLGYVTGKGNHDKTWHCTFSP